MQSFEGSRKWVVKKKCCYKTQCPTKQCFDKGEKQTQINSFVGKKGNELGIYNWSVGKRSQKIPIDGIILREKALEFARALSVTEFKALDCWLNNWKKRYNLSISINFEYFYKAFVTYFSFQKSLTSKALVINLHHQD